MKQAVFDALRLPMLAQGGGFYLQPAVHAELSYIAIRKGKSKNAKRNLSLTARAAEMLKTRKAAVKSPWVFPGDSPDAPILGTSLDHQHYDVRDNLKLSKDFVVHRTAHTNPRKYLNSKVTGP